MENKRPSFQFYPLDWLGDPNVIAMTAEARGAYIQILAAMWTTEDCSLPTDEEYLARIGQVDRTVIAQLSHCFIWGEKLRHKRLDKERKKQDERRAERSEAGKLGNKVRWNKPKLGQSHSDPSAIAKHRSSTTTSSSSTTTTTGVVEKKLLKWFQEMKDVQNPEALTRKYLNLFSEKVIARALDDPACISRNKFSELCEYFK